MIKCQNCGNEINENDSFCFVCGTPVSSNTETVEENPAAEIDLTPAADATPIAENISNEEIAETVEESSSNNSFFEVEDDTPLENNFGVFATPAEDNLETATEETAADTAFGFTQDTPAENSFGVFATPAEDKIETVAEETAAETNFGFTYDLPTEEATETAEEVQGI